MEALTCLTSAVAVITATATMTYARLASLSQRERVVMDLVVEGLANRAIANRLNLSTKTVESHRAKVMEKMQARSVADLVKMAMMDQKYPLSTSGL
jgi:FixJ family two-component response regulator